MKRKFSTSWKGSKRPGKQRKYASQAPRHIRKKLLSVNLSKELRKKYGRRNIPLRKSDIVMVMKGKFMKKTGKVTNVDRKRLKAEIEGIQTKKHDGSKSNIKLSLHLLQITGLNAEDKRRGISSQIRAEEKKNAP